MGSPILHIYSCNLLLPTLNSPTDKKLSNTLTIGCPVTVFLDASVAPAKMWLLVCLGLCTFCSCRPFTVRRRCWSGSPIIAKKYHRTLSIICQRNTDNSESILHYTLMSIVVSVIRSLLCLFPCRTCVQTMRSHTPYFLKQKTRFFTALLSLKDVSRSCN